MKIDNSVSSLGSLPSVTSKTKFSGVRPTSDGSSSGASVQFSARMQEMEAAMGSAPVVDSERVAEIKQAIAEGRFQVSPERIADGLIASVKDMLSRAPR